MYEAAVYWCINRLHLSNTNLPISLLRWVLSTDWSLWRERLTRETTLLMLRKDTLRRNRLATVPTAGKARARLMAWDTTTGQLCINQRATNWLIDTIIILINTTIIWDTVWAVHHIHILQASLSQLLKQKITDTCESNLYLNEVINE